MSATPLPAPVPPVVAHPLDPLSPAELEQAVALVRADGRLGERVSYWGAALDEAHARAVVAGAAAPGRRLRLVVTDHAVPPRHGRSTSSSATRRGAPSGARSTTAGQGYSSEGAALTTTSP